MKELSMMSIPPSQGKLLYHLTHIDNLKGIFKNGLMPRNKLVEKAFTDTADQDIIEKRKNFYYMDLGNFIPFHFFVKNPYDGSVCRKYGSENMAIIAIYRPRSDLSDGYFVIPQHPLNRNSKMFSYNEGFQKIKWDILDNTFNRNYYDSDIRQACLAECDISRTITKEDFAFIYVKTEEAKKKVLAFLSDKQTRQKIQVSPNMFCR